MNQPEQPIFSVLQLNLLAKEMLETLTVWVEGEVSEFKGANSRYFYIYFTLKDIQGEAALPVVIVRHQYERMGLELNNGQKVLLQGKLSLFTKSGSYQFVVNQIQLAGQGQLAAQLEKLKQQLQKEGLLDESRKRSLPTFPQRIGVVTSIASDAWADFQRHSVAKFPLMELTVVDSFVQGYQAPASLIAAIQTLQNELLDVIVITRGGGSAEDLAAFNDERLVRAIAASRIPTLVAVGHEKDISIADLVADLRASTPTNAGQLLTRHYEDALVHLQHLEQKMLRLHHYRLSNFRQTLDHHLVILLQTRQRYANLPHLLNQLQSRLHHSGRQLTPQQQTILNQTAKQFQSQPSLILSRYHQQLQLAHKQLQALSPTNVLARGYSIATVNHQVLKSSTQVANGDTIKIQLHQGSIEGQVTHVQPDL